MEEARKLGKLVGEAVIAINQIKADIRLLKAEIDGETERHNFSTNHIGSRMRNHDERIGKLEEELKKWKATNTQKKLGQFGA